MTEKKPIKIICDNRRAMRDYFIEERHETGIVLCGTEVKALRAGRANLKDSYASFENGELFLLHAHISPYEMGNRQNHDPVRTRKLLMHEKELKRLWGKAEIRGYALVPLKMYFKHGIAKVEIGLGRGKRLYDKRQATKDREEQRNLDKMVRAKYR